MSDPSISVQVTDVEKELSSTAWPSATLVKTMGSLTATTFKSTTIESLLSPSLMNTLTANEPL